MNELLAESLYFGFALSLVTYWCGTLIQKKWKHPICNPLLISVALCILILTLTDISYETFHYGAKYVNYLLTPTTVCLAVPLYKQFQVLKNNLAAILISITSGAVSCILVILGLAAITKLDSVLTFTLMPKSITTAIAIGLSEEIGGIPAVTVSAVVITGLIGSIFAQTLFKLLRISDPVAQGLALGTASHAMGTSKALEIGEIQGAMSSLSIVVAGIITVIAIPIFVNFVG